MKFLCIGYYDPVRMSALPETEFRRVMEGCQALITELYASPSLFLDAGVGESGALIHPTSDGPRVRDLPPGAQGEAIGSITLIEADNLQEAIRIASLHPSVRVAEGANLGWRIEVHPIHSLQKGLAKI